MDPPAQPPSEPRSIRVGNALYVFDEVSAERFVRARDWARWVGRLMVAEPTAEAIATLRAHGVEYRRVDDA